nr:leucine-rich repeat extensin-like protein 5 [Aegilops tauschii subsp. strangulata]
MIRWRPSSPRDRISALSARGKEKNRATCENFGTQKKHTRRPYLYQTAIAIPKSCPTPTRALRQIRHCPPAPRASHCRPRRPQSFPPPTSGHLPLDQTTAGVPPHHRSSSAAHKSTGLQPAAAANHPTADGRPPTRSLPPSPPITAAPSLLRLPNNHPTAADHCRVAPLQSSAAKHLIDGEQHRRRRATPPAAIILHGTTSSPPTYSRTSSPSRPPRKLHRAPSRGSASFTRPRSSRPSTLLSCKQLCLLNIVSLDIAASLTVGSGQAHGKSRNATTSKRMRFCYRSCPRFGRSSSC